MKPFEHARHAARLALAGSVALFALAWFGTLGYRPLYRADEARYAEIAREMVASDDWTTPRLNGFKYFEKPPLQYWATAIAFELAGAHAWTARFWVGLTGFIGIGAAAFVAMRLAGATAGIHAAVILASSALYGALGHFNTLDMGLTLFLSIAVFAFVLAQRDGLAPSARRGWMLAAWAAASAAVLSKGLIGIVLPAASIAAYVVIHRDWRLLRNLHIAPGAAVFLVIAAPWFVAVSSANGEFARFFFIHEHLERFLTKVHGRYEPIWYFGPVLLWGTIPWTLTTIAAVRTAWNDAPHHAFRPLRFLVVWVAVVSVFFSVSSSKLPSYILPVFPALAVIGGAAHAEMSRKLVRAQAVVIAALGLAAAIGAPHLIAHRADASLPAELLAAYAPWLVAAGAALAACAVAAAVLEGRGRRLAGAVALAGGGFLFGQLALLGHARLAPAYSAHDSITKIKSRMAADAPFYSVDTFDHSVPFYLGRTVTMVAYADELGTSVQWEPERFVATVAEFEREWRAAPRAFAVMRPREYATLEGKGLPMNVMVRDPRRVFVEKP